MQDFSWESIWANITKENLLIEARINVNKEFIFNLLKKNNVESVFVSFDGSGDSGGFDTVELTPEATQPLLEEPAIGFCKSMTDVEMAIAFADPNLVGHSKNSPEPEISIQEAIENLCYDILRIKQRGWETNEGSYGSFDINIETRKIRLELNERTVSEYIHEI